MRLAVGAYIRTYFSGSDLHVIMINVMLGSYVFRVSNGVIRFVIMLYYMLMAHN